MGEAEDKAAIQCGVQTGDIVAKLQVLAEDGRLRWMLATTVAPEACVLQCRLAGGQLCLLHPYLLCITYGERVLLLVEGGRPVRTLYDTAWKNRRQIYLAEKGVEQMVQVLDRLLARPVPTEG